MVLPRRVNRRNSGIGEILDSVGLESADYPFEMELLDTQI